MRSLVRINGRVSNTDGGCCIFSHKDDESGRELLVPVWGIPKEFSHEHMACIVGEVVEREFTYGDVTTTLGVEFKNAFRLPKQEEVRMTGTISKMEKGYFFLTGHRGIDIVVELGDGSHISAFGWHDTADYIEENFKAGDTVEITGNFDAKDSGRKASRHPFVNMIKVTDIKHYR